MTLKRLFPLAAYASLAGGVSYLLRDEFITNRAAGAINGTPAEPGPGTRTVIDAGGNLTISNNDLVCAGSAGGTPSLVESQTIQRVLGRMVKYGLKYSGSVVDGRAGFLKSTNPDTGRLCSTRTSGSQFLALNVPNPIEFLVGYPSPIVGVNYCAIVLRMTGAFYFVKTTGQWVLVWDTSTGDNTTTLYVNALWNPAGSAFKSPFICVPESIWIPSPLAYDTFTRSDGVLGNTESPGPDGQGSPILAWNGPTWTITGNKAINTPSLTTNKLTDPGLEAWTSPTDLTNYNETGTVEQETTVIHGGGNSAKLTTPGSAIYQHKAGQTPNAWVKLMFWLRATASGNKGDTYVYTDGPYRDPGTTWTQYTDITRNPNNAVLDYFFQQKLGGGSIYFDDLSLQTFTLPELFATVNVNNSNVIISVNITLGDVANEEPAGIVARLDSATNPQNFLIAYLDLTLNGIYAKIDKCVNGVYTTVTAAAAAYSAGGELRLVLDGATAILLYKDTIMGTVQTINEPAINNNVLHGLFSTDPINGLDVFKIWARGTSGEYNILDGF